MKAIAFVGYSGSGKTTLIERLIPCLISKKLCVSAIKHAHHDFDPDVPGKDSWRHRQAGAYEVLITSSKRWALIHELRGEYEPTLDEQLKRLSPCDLVIVEGWKSARLAKIEVHRKATGHPVLFPGDPFVIAVVTDEPLNTKLPQFALDDVDALVTFLIDRLRLLEPKIRQPIRR